MGRTKGKLTIKKQIGNRWFVQLRWRGKAIATMINSDYNIAVANAEHLIKCWNSHDKLLEALQKIADLQAQYYKVGIGYDNAINNIAKWAIAEAEKK
ncbi:hypothetical protein LCGC14_0946040 [marine sediment metagenome]|uniref:Uncharacterized protein n=1 Tax=marine sediment metagenome TaxID=412755 RepID=A0A0F9RQ23_9ZZZZ